VSEPITIKAEALEPLFDAWEEPSRHRVRAAGGEGAELRNQRRPSPIGGGLVQNVRAAVKEWRDNYYFGASETSRHLLHHWFGRAHRMSAGGTEIEFRYYFCQREAIETLVYLKEVRRTERLSQLIAEFGATHAEAAALGITEEEDAWSRYAFKMATGSGKTKVMSLAVVWSYFHALRESESPMARHFVVIAPNLTVFERLKEDFKPEGGGPDVFDKDPLIPAEWRGDWNLSTVLQDEASGAATGAVLYLTNIHRLFDTSKRKKTEGETFDWMGPPVSRARALDTSAELRDRITAHPRLMVLNDEAHHAWDPDSAWNEAIAFLHETCLKRGGEGLAAQLDFSATPKDNKANYFKHVVCDTPLGEAVDAGIVKTPIIGRAGQLIEQATDNAAYRYEAHLLLGYQRWLKSKEEWAKSGRKPLLFVMCEDTTAADQIAARLGGDELFKELNGRALNLHTRLKGKIKSVGTGANRRQEFVENEKEISDEDLKELRRLSRELDSDSSPYFCIVSVLMLREGWDVRNVTTIVPLRPYTSKAGILPEQTLGRGLRRMTPPGQANEVVAVVEHEAFARLYREELAQEGLPIEVVDVDKVPSTTVSIFPDAQKDVEALDIAIPRLTAGARTLAALGPISENEVREAFRPFKPLPLGELGPTKVPYEGRHLITGEVVEQMKVNLALLESGVGAISFYERELEYICKVKNTHQVLGPLLHVFFEQVLFGPGQSIFDPKVVHRLSASDVREHVRAVFVPLIREKTVRQQVRVPEAPPVRLSDWRPFQVTANERRPVLVSARTLFNLVPCNRSLEQALTGFLSKASDVSAFAKNAGPQALRIGYLADGQRLAFYTPDFFVRAGAESFLVETKGQVDRYVPAKARAAVEWCKAAGTKKARWSYVYVPEGVYQRFQGTSFAELVRMCAPALHDLTMVAGAQQTLPPFAAGGTVEEELESAAASGLVEQAALRELPERLKKAVEEAVSLFLFFERKTGANYAPAFAALLGVIDETAKGLVTQKLGGAMPTTAPEQRAWFEPYLGKTDPRTHRHYQELARNLQKTLVFKTGVSPLGLLRNCFDYALNDKNALTGVFETIKDAFRYPGAREQLAAVQAVNDFRNTRVAHQEKPLDDKADAKKALKEWIDAVVLLWTERFDAGYGESCAVELKEVRGKDDPRRDFLLALRVHLPRIALPPLGEPTRALIRRIAGAQIQPLVDYRFGAGKARAECRGVEGSIDLLMHVTAAGAGADLFVKDRDRVRATGLLLAGDVRTGCGRLKRAIEAEVKKLPKNGDSN
jgi:type III restriction enzyme